MAEDLGISPRTLHYLITVGCPCIQLRKLLWFDRDKVFRWLDRFERKGKHKVAPKFEEAEEAEAIIP